MTTDLFQILFWFFHEKYTSFLMGSTLEEENRVAHFRDIELNIERDHRYEYQNGQAKFNL